MGCTQSGLAPPGLLRRRRSQCYVAGDSRGKGTGRALLDQLISESEQNGIWTLQASVFPENAATIGLHRVCGFREVGRRERIGRLNSTWRDTLLLERRSPRVGVE